MFEDMVIVSMMVLVLVLVQRLVLIVAQSLLPVPLIKAIRNQDFAFRRLSGLHQPGSVVFAAPGPWFLGSCWF